MLESFGVMNAGLYALGALALVLAPGPNSIFVFKTSIQYGSKPAFHAALAVFLGDAALIFLAYLGVAAVRIAGAAYLAYLGLSVLISTYRGKKAGNAKPETLPDSVKPFRTALVLSLTNPKAILFYVAFFSQFINPGFDRTWIPYLVMASILEAFSICWMSTLALSGAAIQRFVSGSPLMSKVGNTLLGSLFLGFAGKLAAL